MPARVAARTMMIGQSTFRMAVFALVATSVTPAMAQAPAPSIGIELNGAEANAKACRLSFVITNKQPTAIDDMALELVLFDKAGRVDRFVVVRSGKVPTGKARVRQFDMPETDCGALARVLLNDVKECSGAGLTPALCADRLTVSTLAGIAFEN
jgi:hypothetical protein